MSNSSDVLDNQVRISDLYHVYGELLSERQRTFIELYYDENLSLSEIASQHNISRQAVHDAIKHGRKALSRYEAVLGLLETRNQPVHAPVHSDWKGKFSVILDEMENTIGSESMNGDASRLKAQIASLRDLLRETPLATNSHTVPSSNGDPLA